jgi:hypothetical protein
MISSLSPHIVKPIKLREIEWACHVAYMEEKRWKYKIWWEKLEVGKIILKYIIDMWASVDWIDLA